MFDRFRQADATTTRLHGGLGPGPAIVRHIVELHGGRTEERSAGAGQGATFLVSLPQLESAEATASAASARPLREPAKVDLHGVRVLVVSDDVDARELLGVILQEAGVRPSIAGNASEALDLLSNGPLFDAVISDLAMPGQDGYALIAAIRAPANRRHRGVAAIAFTAYTGESDEARARSAGFNAFLNKPIDPYTLIRTLGDTLRRDRSRAS